MDDAGDTPDQGPEIEVPTDVAIEEPTSEATEEPVPDETQEPTIEVTEEPKTEATGEADAETTEETDAEGTPGAEIEKAEEQSTPAAPTATEEPEVPDELQVVGDVNITVAPGEYRDVVVRYTLGSDRDKTEMSANLTAPGGESLDNWSLVPWQRADLDEDPNDTNRHLKARINYADNVENGDVYETTWRVTAPDHIEVPVTVRLYLGTKIHSEDGVTDGVIKNDLVSFNATASVHNPTFTCHEVVTEEVDNTWNCAFETAHPDDDVVLAASAEVPEGWELVLNDSPLGSEPLALTAETIAAGGFTIAATYPIGCPDIGATFNSTMTLAITYPSGEVRTLTADLSLAFERPTPKLEITSFVFTEMDILETLSTTGTLKLAFADAPCAWQGTIQIADLHSDSLTVNNASIAIVGTDANSDALITMSDRTISIVMPDSTTEAGAGEITIQLQIDLSQQIPPGTYVINVMTEMSWLEED